MNPDWKSRYDAAVEAAQDAGKLALGFYDTNVTVEWKQDESPVTVADRNAETLLRQTLLGRFPNDGFLGEEYGDQPGSSGFRWVVDPVDGTRSFVRGIPIWATLVGLEYQGEQIAGVAVLPAMGDTYRALRGAGAYRNERRIHVSNVASLHEAVLFYSSVSWFVKAGRQDDFLKLATLTQRQRGFGDFYGFVLVAQGSGEVMIEHGVHIWDVVALKAIIEEAGGRFSDWQGNATVDRPDVLATNGLLHDEVLRIVAGRQGA